jgi:hypothetical protein
MKGKQDNIRDVSGVRLLTSGKVWRLSDRRIMEAAAEIKSIRLPGAPARDDLLLQRPEASVGTPPSDLVPFARESTFEIFRVE